MSDNLHLEENPDIEQMPTPKTPGKREVVSRIEVNAKSLKLLCRDMAVFIDGSQNLADLVAPHLFFTRMYQLLLRLSHDIAGHEYNAAHAHAPLSPEEISETMLEDLRESFSMMDKALLQRLDKRPLPDREIKSLLDEIDDLKQDIEKKLFTIKPKKQPTDVGIHP